MNPRFPAPDHADVPVFEDGRHSYASRALALGEGLPIIGRLLGYRQTETTTRYAHLDRGALRKSAERVAVRIAGYL